VVHLAEGFVPEAETEGDRLGFWLEVTVRAEDWARDEPGGGWWTPYPFGDVALYVLPSSSRVYFVGDHSHESFHVEDGRLWFRPDPEEGPPREYRRAVFVPVGERYSPRVPGLGPRWRLRVGGLTTDAIPVWPGQEQAVTAEVPRGARLDFATTCVGPVRDGELAEVVLRVHADDELVFETTLPRRVDPHVVRHAVELPDEIRGSVTFRVSVEGSPSLVTLHDPVLSATEEAEREAEALERRDIVVILVDTFRADNLTFYGGQAGVTPNLDRFADQAVRFENAWAPSSWTLPSHGSLFTGVHPHQHGAIHQSTKLGDGLVTLTERLAAGGYRTGAVTNSVFVSVPYGMDRGFEWFEERSADDLSGTLTSAFEFLEADDGRPTFLFVHSYRVHGPYWVTPSTMEQHGERLGLQEGLRVQNELREIMRRSRSDEAAGDSGSAPTMQRFIGHAEWSSLLEDHFRSTGLEDPAEIERAVDSMMGSLHGLYLGGVLDFDVGFGRFLAALDERGAVESTSLIVTSDHGEAFGEHGVLFHGVGVWDEVLRIPLLIRAPGIPAETDMRYASLVDLPPTIAALAGMAPSPDWEGESLLAERRDRPVFSFDCAPTDPSAMTVIQDGWKIVFPAEASGFGPDRAQRVFHLAEDPGEEEDLAGGDRSRVGEILRERREDLARILNPLQTSGDVELDSELRLRMRKLGY